jgi:hypothetical protein
MEGSAFVEEGSIDGAEEVGSAASVGDGKLVLECTGGRTSYSDSRQVLQT